MIDRLMVQLTRRKKEMTQVQISRIRNEQEKHYNRNQRKGIILKPIFLQIIKSKRNEWISKFIQITN